MNKQILLKAQSSDERLRSEAAQAISKLWNKQKGEVLSALKYLIPHKNRNGLLTAELICHHLLKIAAEETLELIQEWCHFSHQKFRLIAARISHALIEAGTSKSLVKLQILEYLIEDRNQEVRREAISQLSKLLEEDDIDLIDEWVVDPDPEVRWFAGKSLANLLISSDEPTFVLNRIQELLKESDDEIRWSAGVSAIRELMKADINLALSLLKDYGSIKMKSNHLVINFLEQVWNQKDLREIVIGEWSKNSNRYIRLNLIKALNTYPIAGSFALLQSLSKAKYADIRTKTTELLGSLYNIEKNARILIILHKLQKDKSKTVRKTAQSTLKSIKI